MSKIKRLVIILLVVLYNFSFFGKFLLFLPDSPEVGAEEKKDNTNLVALFVDESIYSDLEAEVENYTDYIQQKKTDTKVLTIPVNKENFKAKDIRKIIENLYFEGQKDAPSSLRGIILAGDVPLPVVNKNGFIFPSVYPYVDLENQKYTYNKDSSFFEYQESGDSNPEIWHSIIKFDDISEYRDYFDKLKDYKDSPNSFVDKKFWYEDFVHMKEVFNSDFLSYYVNKLVFLEDRMYHRYTSLLIDLLMKGYKDQVKNMSDKYSKEMENAEDKIDKQLNEAKGDEFSSFREISKSYSDKISEFKNTRMGDGGESLKETVSQDQNTDATPTLTVKKSIQNFFKSYSELFSSKYISTLRENIKASGRRNYTDEGGEILQDEVDSHFEKIMLKDEISKNILKEFNDKMEKNLDEKIREEDYYMKIPVYKQYKKSKGSWNGGDCLSSISDYGYKLKEKYRNYYFGKYAGNITGAHDLSIYRGTYKNFDSVQKLSGEKIQDQRLEENGTDLAKNSLGASYGIASRQIEANRGINVMKAQKDKPSFSKEMDDNNECYRGKGVVDWSRRWRGGASPLNIDYESGDTEIKLNRYDYRYAGYPRMSGKGVGGSIYDIAGSKLVNSEKEAAYSYKAREKYASSILVKDDRGEKGYCNENKKFGDYKKFLEVYDGDNISAGEFKKINVEDKTQIFENKKCVCTETYTTNNGVSRNRCTSRGYDYKYVYDYNLISSIVEHKSVTEKQLTGMNMNTKNRPIDDPRYVTFQGIGGDEMKFIYPNLLNVEVYKKQGSRLVLKDKEEIADSIREYLKKKVNQYNEQLNEQLDNKDSYYNQNPEAFDFLANVDSLATPERSYSTMDEDFFIELIGEEKIKILAENLYYLNQGLKEKTEEDDIMESITFEKNNFDVNQKLSYILDEYLTPADGSEIEDKLTLPQYNSDGYEAGYINSDGVDVLNMEGKPQKIKDIENAQNNFESNYQDQQAIEENSESDKGEGSCGIPPSGAVTIWKWPEALQCWLSQELPQWQLQLSSKCSRGPTIFSTTEEKSSESSTGGEECSNGCEEETLSADSGAYTGLRLTYNEFDDENFPVSRENYLRSWTNFLGVSDQLNQKILSESIGEQQREEIQKMQNGIKVNLSPSSVDFSDSFVNNQTHSLPDVNNSTKLDQEIELSIASNKDVGNVDVTIANIGDSCFAVNGNNLCRSNYNLSSFDPSDDPQAFSLNIGNTSYFQNKAGGSLFQFKICKENGFESCVYKDKILNITPGSIDELKFISPTDKLVKGGVLPFKISGYDKWGNKLEQILQDYQVSVDKGNLLHKGGENKNRTFNNFSKAYFLYNSSSLNESFPDNTFTIDVTPTEIFEHKDPELPKLYKELEMVEGDMEVLSGGSSFDSISYSLPEHNNLYYKDKYGIKHVDEDKLFSYKLSLETQDGEGLMSPVRISTAKGIMQPGKFSTGTINVNTGGEEIGVKKTSFQSKKYFYVRDGVLEFYLKPSFRAGEDVLQISVPGKDPITKKIEVAPSSPRRVDVSLAKENAELGENVSGKMKIKDVWGNNIKDTAGDVNVELGTMGALEFGDSDIKRDLTVGDGEYTFQVKADEPGGKGYVYGELKADKQQSPDYAQLAVRNTLWPKKDLNIMYLNLFGTDRGNQRGYFSENEDEVIDVMNESSKNLSTTTMLTDPSKVKKTELLISSDLRIMQNSSGNIGFSMSGGKIYFEEAGEKSQNTQIEVGNISDYEISFSDKKPENIVNNKIIYNPAQTDSYITGNVLDGEKIKINGETVIDFSESFIGEKVTMKLVENPYTEFTTFQLKYTGRNIGELIFYRNDNYLIDKYPQNIETTKQTNSTIGFTEGSTNRQDGILFYDVSSNLGEQSSSAKSIEDSEKTELNIGFREDFKNITLFGGGETVGESTKDFSSEFLVNYGDPLLTRINENEEKGNTEYGGGVGDRIHAGEGEILKVLTEDFNNDGMKDVVVAYKDGTIKFKKNYGGDIPFKDLNNLMFISDGIKDIFAGDVDGNGYSDLLVRSGKDKLRVYENKEMDFDLNGNMVCLDVAGGPESMKDVSQIFFEDMDKDGALDIVTNDINGDIKIFYGGENNGENYISDYPYKCGENWKDGLDQKLVKSYSVEINEEEKIYDPSLLHREGLEKESVSGEEMIEMQPSNAGDDDSGNLMDGYQNTMGNMVSRSKRFREIPEFGKPVYESETDGDITNYIVMPFLTGSDEVNAYKKFEHIGGEGELKKGDMVEVEVHISADSDTKVSYLDKLEGAFDIPRGNDGSITTFNRGNLEDDVLIKRNEAGRYHFMVDDISMDEGEEKVFSYEVKYRGGKLVDIGVENLNEDEYKDIKVQPNDGCIKGYWKFINKLEGNNRTYSEEYEDISEKIEDYKEERQENTQENIEEVKDSVKEEGSDALRKFDFQEAWNDSDFLKESGGGSLNVDVTAFEGMAEGTMKKVDSVLKGLCEGFDMTECGGGMPVPTNIAFLSPGKLHALCYGKKDPGFPIFYFPGTIYPIVPVPAPGPIPGQKAPSDGFYGPSGGTYPSMIRMYLSPTLTQGLGLALCFGPYEMGMNVPKPFNTVGGNCIVVAKSMSSSCDDGGEDGDEGSNAQGISPRQKDLSETDSCDKSDYGSKNTSPINLYSDSGNLKGLQDSISFDINGEEVADISPKQLGPEEEETMLKGGSPLDLRIEKGEVGGIVGCIMKGWVDKQLRYIINNLTNMSVYIYLPDLSGWSDGWGDMKDKIGEIGGSTLEYTKKMGEEETYSDMVKQMAKVTDKETWEKMDKKIREKVEEDVEEPSISELGMEKESFENVSSTFSNPFEQISQFFEKVRLINIETKELVIRIPWMSEEEIKKQINYLQGRVSKNMEILKEWENMVKSLGNPECRNNSDKCSDEQQKYVQIAVKAGKLINSVRENIKILQKWSEFPMKLYDYIHIVDRYMTELSCIIEEFINGTVGWMKKNADRFEKWVDLMIVLRNIMDTWQVLIDFSVEWRTQCAQCRQDNYDYHKCQLSLLCPDLPVLPIPPFKLPDIYLDFSHFRAGVDVLLPKFRFQPVKRPRISLPDLPVPPQMDIGITIPSVPTLPEPPTLPELPSVLPTVEVDFPAVIPPAPKIPPIMPQISATISIAEFIGKIYCIIKQGVGLVAENNVKTRIEQMTQRTRRVPSVDSISMTVPETPVRGADIRMDAYTNLKFDFEKFYEKVESVTDMINEKTNKVMKGVNVKMGKAQDYLDEGQGWVNTGENYMQENVGKGEDYINTGENVMEEETQRGQEKMDEYEEYLQDSVDSGENYIHEKERNYGSGVNFQLYGTGLDGKVYDGENLEDKVFDSYNYSGEDNRKYKENIFAGVHEKLDEFEQGKTVSGYNYDFDKKGIGLDKASSLLSNGLAQLKEKSKDYQRNEKIDKIMKILDTNSNVTPNKEAVQRIEKDVQKSLNRYSEYYEDLAESIKNDYKSFVEEQSSNKLVSSEKFNSSSYNVKLFKGNEESIEYLKHGDSPTKKYIALNNRMLKGFDEALEENTVEELKMQEEEYKKTKNHVANLYNKSNRLLEKGSQSKIQNQGDGPSKLAASCPTCGDSSSSSEDSGTNVGNSMSIDLSNYIKGFFVEGKDGEKYYNVIDWQEKGNKVYKNENYEKVDINGDGKQDIVWRDENEVFVKYHSQNSQYNNGEDNNNFSESFKLQKFASPEELKDSTDEDGFYSLKGDEYKIRDEQKVIEGLERQGQSHNSISFSWKSKQEAKGYLVRFIPRVDCFYENAEKECSGEGVNNFDTQYVLVTNSGTNLGNTRLYDDQGGDFDGDFIFDYTVDKIHSVERKALSDEKIKISLQDLPNKWYYVQVSALGGSYDCAPDVESCDNLEKLEKSSPRSAQKVGGSQIWADEQSPSLEVDLIRQKNNKVISEGSDLKGYINTHYRIEGNWDDNIGVKENRVVKGDEIVSGDEASSVVIDNLSYSEANKKQYKFVARDHVGNIHRETVSFEAAVPDISVENIELENSYGVVTSKLSNEIDEGKVEFQRKRNGYWEVLSGFINSIPNGEINHDKKSLYDIDWNSTTVTGGIFKLNENISLFNKDEDKIGEIGVDSGKIDLKEEYEENYEKYIDFSENVPIVKIKDKEENRVVYSVYFKPDSLAGNIPVEVYNGNYRKMKIESDMMGDFKGGYCVQSKEYNECVAYIDKKGYLYFGDAYKMDFEGEYKYNDSSEYVEYNIKNNEGELIFDLKFIPESLKK